MLLVFLIISTIICIVLSAILSSAETAYFSLSSMQIRLFRESLQEKERLVAGQLDHPRDLLVTLLLFNILVSLLVQNIIARIFYPSSLWIINVGLPLFLTLIFGEFIPKSFAIANNISITTSISPYVQKIQAFTRPLQTKITPIATFISHYLFFFLKNDKDMSAEELTLALDASVDSYLITREEARLVQGYISLEEDLVKSIMRPRQEIYFYLLQGPIDQLMSTFVEKGVSRVPVCDGEIQNVKGILYHVDFFLHLEKITSPKDIVTYLHKPSYIPEIASATQLFYRMLANREVISLVVDEYSMVSGLITLEDLYERIIGQVADRRDEKPLYTRIEKNALIASGRLPLLELEEILQVDLTSPSNMKTIGGYLTEQIGEAPKSGTKWETKELLFQILSSNEKRIQRIYIRKL